MKFAPLKLGLKMFYLKFKFLFYRVYVLFYLLSRLGVFKGNLPSDKTKLCIEGYPSSANSYFLNFASRFIKKSEISSHNHAIATIKYCAIRNIPTVFIIRHPLDAISSHMVRHGKSASEAIYHYLQLYEYVLKNRSRISVVNFSDVISDKSVFINKLSEILREDLDAEINIKELDELVIRHLSLHDNKRDNARTTSSLLPSSDKNLLKESVSPMLSQHGKYNDCIALYKTLHDLV